LRIFINGSPPQADKDEKIRFFDSFILIFIGKMVIIIMISKYEFSLNF